ncbi:DUF2637 domain-containing protein [Streptomyces sp. NBC_00341]|uniref:DUF2637 domain-containing protein n=1 Tax=Streptomyces sp. NBC_00341 TaxID=2975717 RepID=UPI00308DB0D2|nr:DUF2637 domain-containing protein [Streptomyces sp. NBC_00341]
MNGVQIRSAERALSTGTWLIVGGAMLYSILTVTPLMAKHTADRWDWTAPILPLVVDAAVVIVVRLDSVLARLGGHGGRWPVVLRWMTGCMTLALNIADSALKKDLVGAAVHAVAPLLLIVTAETGLAYRRAIAAAQNAHQARQKAEQQEQEEAAARKREAAEQREREAREHATTEAREQREHEARLSREQTVREEAERREERERAEDRERSERDARERREREREQQQAERERLEREAAQRRELEAREREARERREREREQQQAEHERQALLSAGPAEKRQEEPLARATVRAACDAGLPIRQAAELCGWSTGWVTARYQEHRDTTATVPDLEGASA